VLSPSSTIPIEAALGLEVLAVGGEAIVGGRCRPQPEQVVEPIELDFRTVAIPGLGQPDQHPKLEFELIVEPAAIRSPAGRVEIAVPATQADVVGSPLEQRRPEIERQPASHERDVLREELLL